MLARARCASGNTIITYINSPKKRVLQTLWNYDLVPFQDHSIFDGELVLDTLCTSRFFSRKPCIMYFCNIESSESQCVVYQSSCNLSELNYTMHTCLSR